MIRLKRSHALRVKENVELNLDLKIAELQNSNSVAQVPIF